MKRGSGPARLCLGALACAGIAGAHRLAYLFAAPDHGHAELLGSTGHVYWPYFAPVAMAALVVGLSWPLIQGFRSTTHDSGMGFIPTALVLGLIQVTGFLALEVGERMLFAEAHSLNLLSEPVVLWGLALQVVVALAAALVIRVLARAAEFVARMLGPVVVRRTGTVRWLTSQTHLPILAPASGGPSLRAPPLVR